MILWQDPRSGKTYTEAEYSRLGIWLRNGMRKKDLVKIVKEVKEKTNKKKRTRKTKGETIKKTVSVDDTSRAVESMESEN